MEQMVQMEQAARKPEINVIPATVRSVESGGQIKKQRNLRVAAYCRVSPETKASRPPTPHRSDSTPS